MKTLYTLFAFLVLALVSTTTFAQGVMQFEAENHTFDAIIEGELASHDFKFTNVGDKPVIISHVQASCGCTTPTWTKEPIMPGKQGVITAAYNSAGRPGPFAKTITVTSSAKPSTLALSFRGVVLKKADEQKLTSEEKIAAPKLVLDRNATSIGKIEYQQKVTSKFKVTNTGRNALNIKDVQSACLCTSFKVSKPEIGAGESADLEITFSGLNKGAVNEKVYISSNDPVTPYSLVTMKVNVVDKLVPSAIMKESSAPIPFK